MSDEEAEVSVIAIALSCHPPKYPLAACHLAIAIYLALVFESAAGVAAPQKHGRPRKPVQRRSCASAHVVDR